MYKIVDPRELPRKRPPESVSFKTEKNDLVRVMISAALRDGLKPSFDEKGYRKRMRVHLLVDGESGYFAVSRADDDDPSAFEVAGLGPSGAAYFTGYKLTATTGIKDGKYEVSYGEESFTDSDRPVWTAKFAEDHR